MDATVLIATRNRAGVLASTLEALAALDTARLDWELIVVDNGSTDRTASVVAQWAGRLPIRFVVEPVPGKNRALNRALPGVRGELVVFTDDDVVPVRQWLTHYVDAARLHPAYDVFAGPVRPQLPPGCPPWLRDHAFAAIAFARFDPQRSDGPLHDVSPHGPNYAVRRDVLRNLRFDERIGAADASDRAYPLGDETEMLRRLRARSGPAYYLARAAVEHRIDARQLEMDWLLERAFRAGRGEVCIAPDTRAVRVAGAPRYLWRQLAAARLRYGVAALRGVEARFEAGIQLEYVKGQVHQYRCGRRASQAGG